MIPKDEISKHLNEEYSQGDIMARIDDEIINGGWGDDYDNEENDCNNEYDYYHDFCNGEAEDVVVTEISKELCDHFNISEKGVEDELRELIILVYPDLDH
jgi:hypothetical protein